MYLCFIVINSKEVLIGIFPSVFLSTLDVSNRAFIFSRLQTEETLSLVRLIESTGVAAIAVHGRTREERPHDSNHDDIIRAIAQAVKTPILAK